MTLGGTRTFIEQLYEAAEHAGFLVDCRWRKDSRCDEHARVRFLTHDQSVLDGLMASAQPTVTYPSSVLRGLAEGHKLIIDNQRYSVREVQRIGDGTETRATLAVL
jgi:hypothetical protein